MPALDAQLQLFGYFRTINKNAMLVSRFLVEVVLDDRREVVIQFLDGTLERLPVHADVTTTLLQFDSASESPFVCEDTSGC